MRRLAPLGFAFVVLGCSSSSDATNTEASGGASGSAGAKSGAGGTAGHGGAKASGSGGAGHAGSPGQSGGSGPGGAPSGGAAGKGAAGKAGGPSGGGTQAGAGGHIGAGQTQAGGAPDTGGAADTGGAGGSTVVPGSVTFTIDLAKGPDRQFDPPAGPTKISPLVYGINGFGAWNDTTKWGFARQGGDAFTDWNWTNNYSNSGADYCFYNGPEDGGAALAGWITKAGYSIPQAQAHGVPFLATTPILEHVSAAFDNNTGINDLCPQNTGPCSADKQNPYDVNSGNLDFVSTDPNSKAFVKNTAKKPSGFCTCDPAGPCASGCKVSATGDVYQDELVNFLKAQYGNGGSAILFSLDNEPNYWGSTHPEVWPFTGSLGCGTDGLVTFDDIVTRNVTFATAIKDAWAEAPVFGPVVAQDGIVFAHSYNDGNLPKTFTDYYLEKLAAASNAAGKQLIDAYDVHYYTAGQNADDCLQAPRLFWDPNFTEWDANKTGSVDFGYTNDLIEQEFYPRQMAPKLLGKIAAAYGGAPAPGLSFSEYNAGCELQIEGGVAEADLLGIFGREGVYAASAWPLTGQITDNDGKIASYLVSAYDLFRNYDGQGSVVGDSTVHAATTDVPGSSVYAFAHSDDASAVEIVALNKTDAATVVTVNVASGPALTTASVYTLDASQIGVAAGAPLALTCAAGSCAFDYTMPPKSASTLVLR